MPIVPVRRAWDRQPHGSFGIDWSNPLSSGLVFAYLPHVPIDLCKGRPATNGGTAAGLTYSNKGITRAFNQNATVIFARDADMEPSAVTMLCFVKSSASQGSYGRPIGKTYSNAGTSPYDSYGLEYNPGGGDVTGCRAIVSVGGTYYNSDMFVSTSAPQTVGMGYAPGGAGLRAYRDGVRQSTNTTPTGSITYDSSGTGDLIVGGYSDSANGNWVGDVYCAFVWNRLLTDGEVAQWNVNPWQLFA